MKKTVKYSCKCGKVHSLVIHWPDGIHFLICGKRIENKKILEQNKNKGKVKRL